MVSRSSAIKAIFGLAALLLGWPIWADSSSALKYFSSEPASLLDIGLLRLETWMDQMAEHQEMKMNFSSGSEAPVIRTQFDPAVPQIQIDAWYNFSKPHSLTNGQRREHCENKIRFLKAALGVDPKGAPLFEESLLQSFFSHRGSERRLSGEVSDSSAAKFASELDRITVIYVRIGSSMSCSSPLLGDKSPVQTELTDVPLLATARAGCSKRSALHHQ